MKSCICPPYVHRLAVNVGCEVEGPVPERLQGDACSEDGYDKPYSDGGDEDQPDLDGLLNPAVCEDALVE